MATSNLQSGDLHRDGDRGPIQIELGDADARVRQATECMLGPLLRCTEEEYQPGGPSGCHRVSREVIRSLMREEGYTEVPGRDQIETRWHRGFLRWTRTQREVLLRLHQEPAAGSAAQHVAAVAHGREGGIPAAGTLPSPIAPRREVNLFSDDDQRA